MLWAALLPLTDELHSASPTPAARPGLGTTNSHQLLQAPEANGDARWWYRRCGPEDSMLTACCSV